MALSITQGGLNWVASMDDTQMLAAIRRITSGFDGLNNQVASSGKGIEDYARKAASALAAYVSLNAATDLIKDIVRVRGEFQQLEVAFSTMLQSKEKADQLMIEVVQLAATTPFDLQQVANGAKQLLAYGFSAESVSDNIRMLGNVAAGVGAPLNDIIYLYGTLQTQGRAYAKDIQQFTGRGIPIIDQLAKQFGVTKDKVMELVEAGKVGFPEVEKAFKTLTGAGGIFYNLMEAQSKTLTGQISNLQDAWAQMLNDIGKGQEGLAHDVLEAATAVVNNYQTVLDILKLLVITYGTYKAAVIATNAVTAIQTELSKGYTIAETLRYRAMLLSEAATKALNASMLANPAVLVTASVVGLYLSYQKLNRDMVQVKTSQELLAEASKDVFTEFAKQESTIRQYVTVLNNQNIAESVRLNAYNELKKIAPDILGALTFQEAKTKDLTAATNEYITSLRQRVTLEGLQGAYSESLKQQEAARKELVKIGEEQKEYIGGYNRGLIDLAKAQKNYEKALEARKNIEAELALETGKGTREAIEGRIRMLEQEQKYVDKNSIAYKDYEEQINALRKSLNADTAAPKVLRTVSVIDDEIKKLQEEQKNISTTSDQWKAYEKQIVALREERERITGATKAQQKAEESLENKVLAMLESRKSLMEKIAGLQRDAFQSGLLKEQSAVDKIKEAFEGVTKEIEEANKKITQFNEANKGKRGFSAVPLIGSDSLNQLNSAKAAYISNTILKQDSQSYLESIELKKKAFEEFERIQLQGNQEMTEKARQEYADQIGSFDSYVDYLKAERAKIATIMAFGGRDVGLYNSFQELSKKIAKAEDEQRDKSIQDTINGYNQLLQATKTFESEKQEIQRRYAKLKQSLEANATGLSSVEFDRRLKLLNESEAREYKDLQISYARKSLLFRKLNEDLVLDSRRQLKQRLADMEKWLQDGKILDETTGKVRVFTPEEEAALKKYIETIKQLLNDTARLSGVSAEKIKKMADFAASISGHFLTLSQVLQEVNSDLAATLDNISKIVGFAGDAAKAIGSFAAGDIGGGIASSVSAIAGAINFFTGSKESEAQALAQVASFNQQILKGEIDVNIAYRERLRMQAEINKLKLDGLRQEQKLLEEQQQQNYDDYNRILSLLQQQQYIAGQTTEKYGGILGFGSKTRVVDVLGDLTGMTYDQIEKLYMSGQLTEKAKALFESLQKLNQEGVNIDQQLHDLQEQAMELYTGTTSDSILDGIIDGFKNGMRSAADFADNFQDLMRNAILNALKYQTLEKPLQEFYQKFASFSEDGLSQVDISQLQAYYNQIIMDAQKQFDNLQNITGIDLSGIAGSSSNLSGAIKGITEQQADVLAAQFGAQRLTQVQILNINTQQLNSLNMIADNTARLATIEKILRDQQLNGLKIKP